MLRITAAGLRWLSVASCALKNTIMQAVLSIKKRVHSVGEYVSREYFQHLVTGYAQMHPTEEKSVFIHREHLIATLAESASVCGIRFMYGQREGDDPRSRTVLLMACCEGAVKENVVGERAAGQIAPKFLLTAKGHLTHAGERVSTDQCWAMVNRHVDRMSVLLPGKARKDIPR